MHTSTLKLSHSLTYGVHVIKHYRWITVLGIVAIFWIVYALDIRIGEQTFSQSPEHSIVSTVPTQILTILDDPQYAHEHATRVRYIYDQLETLKNFTKAERIYVFSYSSIDPLSKNISKVFEVFPAGQTPQLNIWQGLPTHSWEDMGETAYERNGLHPFTHYSTELYGTNNTMIGSFGIEFMKNVPLLQEHRLLDRIRQTIRDIEAALSQVTESLEIQRDPENATLHQFITIDELFVSL